MNSTGARAGLTTSRETAQIVLLTINSVLIVWALYFASWRTPGDPCFLAAVTTAGFTIFLWLTRRRGPRTVRFERFLVALFLVCMPLVYVLRCLLDATTSTAHFWLWVEVLGLLVFGTLAVLGWKLSPWFLAVGIVLHGVTWDAWHYHHSTYMPDWYAVFCLLVDLALGGYVAARIPVYQAARGSVDR